MSPVQCEAITNAIDGLSNEVEIVDVLKEIRDELKKLNEKILEIAPCELPNIDPGFYKDIDSERIIFPDKYVIRDPMPGEYPIITCDTDDPYDPVSNCIR